MHPQLASFEIYNNCIKLYNDRQTTKSFKLLGAPLEGTSGIKMTMVTWKIKTQPHRCREGGARGESNR